MGAFSKIFQRLRLTPDTTVSTQTTAIIQSTSGSLALVPQGVGAIVASIPDGTATGGNARGTNSVDLQQSRSSAGQVASSNFAFVGGGQNNSTTSGDHYQVVVGGLSNSINASGHSFIGGGQGNSIFTGGGSGWAVISGGRQNSGGGQYSTISGGLTNIASSQYATVSGGQSNTASTNTHATVVGGSSNTSSGQFSVSGGWVNVASGAYSTAFGRGSQATGVGSVSLGYGNTSAGQSSTTFGGDFFGAANTTTSAATYSLAYGAGASSYLVAQTSTASGRFANTGDAQQSLLTARNSSALTTGATLALSLDGTGTTNLIIPNGNNRAWNVTIDTIAVVTAITGTATGVTVGDCYRETKQLLFKRIGGTSSIVGTVDTTAVKSDTSMSACAMTITAGASQQMALEFTAPTFTGGGSVTCRVVSKVSLVEVAY